ncbi:hypothetical protein B0H67DRAFT_492334 [Lasiosphaeris hirsuta]|uniref:Uncharacterized protein n=1 Tax=Lasiosphaeris hirsuta TaxID=260670 RepID=A0AA40A7N6_9PEZI|nr:hypothetical protein B0H67DRAFT_492334 [Lasiosphaeris hirsuta]
MVATPTTTYHLSQFTPAPSCGIGSDLWAVSKTCLMTGGINSPITTVLPGPLPWVSCTAIQMGEPPDKDNADCYIGYRSRAMRGDGSPTYFSACPAGYSTVTIETYYPFYRSTINYRPADGKDPRVHATDVVASLVYCCPTASGFDFKMSSFRLEHFTTVHDGATYRGDTALMPMCAATSVEALSSGQTVTLTPYSDTKGWEKRQEKTADGLLTEAWDPKKKVWAEAESFFNTVFGDGFTCYDGAETGYGEGFCTEYFEKHYTSPEVTLTPSTTNQGGADTASLGSGMPTGAAISTISRSAGTSRTRREARLGLVGVVVLILALGT